MSANNPNIFPHQEGITRKERATLLGTRGATVWFTGLSGSGKTSIAAACERILVSEGRSAYLLDGDNLRDRLNSDLGFSPEDRYENIRRVSEVACLFSDAGMISLVSLISPFIRDRESARSAHEEIGIPFFEVFIDTPIEVCEMRDAKGLYVKARAGELTDFPGVNSPYESPKFPDFVVKPDDGNPTTIATKVLKVLL
jgi:bifunctional enzyme CysN/CysC